MTFMTPKYYTGRMAVVETPEGSVYMFPCDVRDCDGVSGYATGTFYRLSADGYLDCSEWNGPYSSLVEAEMALESNETVCHACGATMPDDDSDSCDECDSTFALSK